MVLFRDKKGEMTDNLDSPVIVNKLRSLPIPKPVPNDATYLGEREKALAFNVKRRNNYIKYQQARFTGEPVDYLPVKMDIENVSRCNFRCSMCQVSDWDKGRRARDMTFEEFRNLIDEQYGLVEIKLQGMGEPCLGNNTFYDSIKYARSQHIWVRTVTNASLLHKNDNYRKIIDAGTNELQISVDGADKDTFEKIRYGSTFEKIVNNCKLINSYCEEIGVVRTKMWTVVQKSNCHQLRELVQLAHEMKFHNMVFSMSLTDWGLDNWSVTNNAVTADEVLSIDFAQELVELGESYDIDVAFWDMSSTYDSSRNKTMCKWPFERAFVSSDMRVVPCCMIANPDTAELGDAVNFTKTWFGTEYQNFRQRHLDGNIPDICQKCYR
jgi:pyrroloquinoline quinone biosynthesis protein E